MRRGLLALILFALLSPGYPQAADKESVTSVPISRSFIGFTPGDSLEEVKREYTLEHAGIIGLRSGEEAVRPTSTPKEADRIILRSLDGTLYEIAVHYTAGYSSDLGWEEFISAAARTYGLPHDEAGDSVTWTDAQTSLLHTSPLFVQRGSSVRRGTEIPVRDIFSERLKSSSWNEAGKCVGDGCLAEWK